MTNTGKSSTNSDVDLTAKQCTEGNTNNLEPVDNHIPVTDTKTTPEPTDDWEKDVWLMASRMAILYMEMAKAIVSRLGEDEGKELIKSAVWKYGNICGEKVRNGVIEKGLPVIPENYNEIPDLPLKGWRSETVEEPSGKKETRITFCPLAAVWKEYGETGLGRLYCWVDQAKFNGYSPGLTCTHTCNVLDGDPYCVIDVHRVKDQANSHES
ncbi:MAG: L-2-amino-thiazoline-4-carboxylic acid hydrolase [Bacillota bacterium]